MLGSQTSEIPKAEALLESLFTMAGCTRAGLGVARELVAERSRDAVEEAYSAAKRGLLSTAVEYAFASKQDPQGKIDLINQLAVTTANKLKDPSKSDPLTFKLQNQAIMVIQTTMDFLKNK